MPIRQQDIANHLGVSIGTVSQALRNAPSVSAEMRRLVHEAAETLGYSYQQRETSRPVLTQIGFLTWSSASNPFYAGVLSGAEHACRERGIALHYRLIHDSSSQALQQHGENGALLVVGAMDEAIVLQLHRLGRPIVLVDNNLPHLGIDRVLIENFGSIYRLVLRLAAQGHRRIAFLRQRGEVFSSFRERLMGYRAACETLQLETLEILCGEGLLIEAGELGLSAWLAEHGQPSFTVLIGCNDEAAIGASHALCAAGVAIPDEVSVVGFDDIDLALAIRPTLATCRVSREVLGELAVQRLIERTANPRAPAQAIVLDTTFVERASLRALPSHIGADAST